MCVEHNVQKIVIKFTANADEAKVQWRFDSMKTKLILRASLVGLEEVKTDVIKAHQLV